MNRKIILVYRIVFTALSLFTILASLYLSGVLNFFSSFKYYTMQSNLMVTIWLTLAMIWYNKPKYLQKIKGVIKGAFTVYITITLVVFAILLQPFYHPTGFAAFSNIVLHYITPIIFIVDWVLTETEAKYKWKYLLYWLIYLLGYISFAIILGTFTGDYLYPFLNPGFLGSTIFALMLGILAGGYIFLGSSYIGINKLRVKKEKIIG